MPQMIDEPRKRLVPMISVSTNAAFKKRVERAAKAHPGAPTTAAFVRWVLDQYMDGKLTEEKSPAPSAT